MSDEFGDRMKEYERATESHLDPALPILVRLDGKRFGTFTQGLARPYDARLSALMVETMDHLMDATGARVGYTQSDEITLVFLREHPNAQPFLGARVQKLASILAASATVFFNGRLPEAIPEKRYAMPVFDCRVWSVPSPEEAANAVLWRVVDATKNAVSMAARTVASHKMLDRQGQADQREILAARGVDFEAYPPFFKWGTLRRRIKVLRPFTTAEIALLPPQHAAHADPGLTVERSALETLDGNFRHVTNRVAYLFGGAAPDFMPVYAIGGGTHG